jgi:predicted O-methyltransferase YrrM
MITRFNLRSKFYQLALDRIRPKYYADHWSVQPFNGQAKRLATIYSVIKAFEPTTCIETGTFIGSSTPYLCSLSGSKTFTVEIDKRTALKAKERFSLNHPSLPISLIIGDSAIEISKILAELDPDKERVLAYLDAHWLDAIPTKTELQELINWGGSWVAIIDDFKIPDDTGYAFDEYGDVQIGISQVPTQSELIICVPSFKSSEESGARRGTGYVFNSKSLKGINLKDINELRVHP